MGQKLTRITCPTCGKRFRLLSALYKHMKEHKQR